MRNEASTSVVCMFEHVVRFPFRFRILRVSEPHLRLGILNIPDLKIEFWTWLTYKKSAVGAVLTHSLQDA